MKASKTLLTFAIIILTAFLFTSVNAQSYKYVGVKKCSMCHKSKKIGAQYKIWKKSAHANAYKTLLTKEADEIAKKEGFKTKAAETPKCLKCHVTAYGVEKKLLGKKYKAEDGVQCESCHGPGSGYAKNSIMKKREKAVAKGLRIFDGNKKKIKELCVTCHNSENPTDHGFDFDKYWAEIKHYIPKK